VSGMDLEEGELSVDFDSREVTYGSGELDELVLAYATTIHKSQGSEYPAVVTLSPGQKVQPKRSMRASRLSDLAGFEHRSR
jgi:ATP-dependent exoDNAse (exonuclease V) alpha subunit